MELYREISNCPEYASVFAGSGSDSLLRGNGEKQVEHGFGVAGMNLFTFGGEWTVSPKRRRG